MLYEMSPEYCRYAFILAFDVSFTLCCRFMMYHVVYVLYIIMIPSADAGINYNSNTILGKIVS